MTDNFNAPDSLYDVAIIGMAGRFPGARNVEEFWQNLRDGVESISFFSDEELAVSDPEVRNNPNLVKAWGVLEEAELFDAAFFGFTPQEAALTDPQQRVFLECAWEAVEDAGYDSETYPGRVGVYAGAGVNTYVMGLYSKSVPTSMSNLDVMVGNEKDFLPTRVSYKLNLRGPSLNIQTACSTSLVAVHVACQDLLNHECDMALAGGVGILLPQKAGYIYQEGGFLPPDGHCRAFDAKAKGAVGGNGVSIVVLKRLADALADGDNVRAIIKGSATNNDGSLKVGYTSPGIEGQATVIADALAAANVDPETIAYLEAHGTGTLLGDPIEIAALTQAFRAYTRKKNFCAIGSAKTNIGHVGAAAGVASLIKTILALENKMIPPTLHFERPNPKIDFANSPFYVTTRLAEWPADGNPRRACVNCYGLGGSNVHVIVEEAPTTGPAASARPWQLLVLSAKTSAALDAATSNLARHFERHPELDLADAAYTLQVGRRAFDHRRALVCRDLSDAAAALAALAPERVLTGFCEADERRVAFMFPGQGAQHVNMALELYQTEPTFRSQIDRCAEWLKPHLELDLRRILYPTAGSVQEAAQQLDQARIAQTALFVIEYALAGLWLEWGIQPQAMVGHGVGEYVAACLAGVLSLEDALGLAAARGRLAQSLPGGKLPEPADPIWAPFVAHVGRLGLKPPNLRYLSNVTAAWITPAEVTDPSYWSRQVRQPLPFSQCARQLIQQPDLVLLEVGPGQTLSALVGRHPDKAAGQIVLASLPRPGEQQSDVQATLNALGQLWLAGVPVDWPGFHVHERRRRLPLPTYPFERQLYWIGP